MICRKPVKTAIAFLRTWGILMRRFSSFGQ